MLRCRGCTCRTRWDRPRRTRCGTSARAVRRCLARTCRVRSALRVLVDPVVAHREASVDVARIQDAPGAYGWRPDLRVGVGLPLEADRELVAFGRVLADSRSTPRRSRAASGSGAHLAGDRARLRDVASRAEPLGPCYAAGGRRRDDEHG